MDIPKIFTKSFNELNKNRIIIVPAIISFLLITILVFTYAGISGYYSAAKDLVVLKDQFDSEQLGLIIEDPEMREAVEFLGQSGSYDEKFVAYATEQGFDWNRVTKPFKSPGGQALIALFVLLYFFVNYYFSCSTFGMIALHMKKKHILLSDMLSQANKFFWRFVGISIATFLIFAVPAGIVGLVPILLVMTIPALGVIAFIAYGIFIIWFIFFLMLRLFFASPVLFVEEKRAIDSIKHAFRISKGRLKNIFYIFAVVYAISIFMNSVAITPVLEFVNNLLLSSSIIKSFIIIMFLIAFILVEAVIITFISMFVLYAYEDFKKRQS